MDFRRSEDTTLDFGHLVVDANAEVAHELVFVELGAHHQVVDFFLAIGRRASRRLDHGRRLHISELLDAPLAGHDVANLER